MGDDETPHAASPVEMWKKAIKTETPIVQAATDDYPKGSAVCKPTPRPKPKKVKTSEQKAEALQDAPVSLADTEHLHDEGRPTLQPIGENSTTSAARRPPSPPPKPKIMKRNAVKTSDLELQDAPVSLADTEHLHMYNEGQMTNKGLDNSSTAIGMQAVGSSPIRADTSQRTDASNVRPAKCRPPPQPKPKTFSVSREPDNNGKKSKPEDRLQEVKPLRALESPAENQPNTQLLYESVPPPQAAVTTQVEQANAVTHEESQDGLPVSKQPKLDKRKRVHKDRKRKHLEDKYIAMVDEFDAQHKEELRNLEQTYQSEHDELRRKLTEEFNKSLAILTSQLDAANVESARKTHLLKTADQTQLDRQRQLVELQQQNEELIYAVKQHEAGTQQLLADKEDNLQRQRDENKMIVEQLEAVIQHHQNENKRLKTAKQQLETGLQCQHRQIQQLEANCLDYETRMKEQNSQERIKDLEEKVELYRIQAREHKNDFDEERTARARAVGEREDATRMLEETKREARADKQAAAEELEELRRLNTEIDARFKKALAIQSSLLDEAQAEIARLLRTADQTRLDHQRQLEELQQENEELNRANQQAELNRQDELAPYVLPHIPHLGECQGAGAFGSVYNIRLNGIICTAKRIHDILLGQGKEEKVSLEDQRAAYGKFYTECVLLSRMRHPNIVQFMGVHYGPHRDYGRELTLVMERLYMNLEDCLKQYQSIEMWLKVSILLDVSQGLLHLHSLGIVHRDLTAANILLTTSFHAKIADLGVSRIINVHPLAASKKSMIPGSLGYMPPEALAEVPEYSYALDIFSFGVLILYVLNQEYPQFYEDCMTVTSVQRKEIQIQKRIKWIDVQSLDTKDPWRQLICRCLQDVPHRRPTTRDLNSCLIRFAQQHPIPFVDIMQMQRKLALMTPPKPRPRRLIGHGQN